MDVRSTPVRFEIPADDVERAAKFYRELFGWKIGEASKDFPGYWMVETVPTDENQVPTEPGINGGLLKRHTPGLQIINYINVNNVDVYSKKVEELGGKILMPKTAVEKMGWSAVVQDTEGNTFGLWQSDMSATAEK